MSTAAPLHRSSGAKKRRHQDDNAESYAAIPKSIQSRMDSDPVAARLEAAHLQIKLYRGVVLYSVEPVNLPTLLSLQGVLLRTF